MNTNATTGQMRSQVTYEEPVFTNVEGQLVPSYPNPQGPFSALVRTPTGREIYSADQQKAVIDKVVECFYPGFEFASKGRLIYGTQIFEVVWSTNVDQRNQTLVTYCKTRST